MSMKNNLYAIDIIRKFNLKVLNNEQFLNEIKIENSSIVRSDFELTGQIVYDKITSIMYFGTKETKYLSLFSKNEIENKIKQIFKMTPPFLLIGPNFTYKDIIIRLSNGTKIPIVETSNNLQILHLTICNWMQEKMSTYHLYHGSLMSVFGTGTLIIGKSGIGKSELAISLVKKGHIFVGDDAILVTRIGQRLFGKPDDSTKNFIEVRGLGVLNFQKVFGIERQIKNSKINIVCELVDGNEQENTIQFERLGNKINYKNIEGIDIPYYKIPVLQGRNTSDLIETAVTDLKLKQQGYFSANEFINQVNKKRTKSE